MSNVLAFRIGSTDGPRGYDPHVSGQSSVQGYVDILADNIVGAIDDYSAMVGEPQRLHTFLRPALVPPPPYCQITVVLDLFKDGFLNGFLESKDQMLYKDHPALHGTDIRLGVGVRDIFNPDQGLPRVGLGPVGTISVHDSGASLGHDRPSWET